MRREYRRRVEAAGSRTTSPDQMCDALSRNVPKLPPEVEILLAHCLAHYLDSSKEHNKDGVVDAKNRLIWRFSHRWGNLEINSALCANE